MADEQGMRFNDNKPKLSLILEAPEALIGVTRVLEHGMVKYSRGNWHKGLPYTEIIDSTMRHLLAIMRGEDLDNGEGGSGLPHVDHLACNAIFLSEMYHTNKTMDDRIFKPEETT